MNWLVISCLATFVSGSKITGSISSPGKRVSPDLEVVDPAVITGGAPSGITFLSHPAGVC